MKTNRYENARDAIRSAKAHLEKTSWIPVGERLPEEDGRYLVTVKRGCVKTAIWVGNAENWNEVTAWMPFPKPYVKESVKIGETE